LTVIQKIILVAKPSDGTMDLMERLRRDTPFEMPSYSPDVDSLRD
jgi:hypothetical protein